MLRLRPITSAESTGFGGGDRRLNSATARRLPRRGRHRSTALPTRTGGDFDDGLDPAPAFA
jgi:hypothetical protein